MILGTGRALTRAPRKASVAKNRFGSSIMRGIAGAAFLTGQSIIVHDAYADPRFNSDIDRETGFVTKTVLFVYRFAPAKAK